MTRAQLLLLLGAGVVAAGSVAVLGDWGTEKGKTYTALAIADCAQARIDDKTGTNVTCDGDQVVARIKWTGEVPAGYELVEAPTEIAAETLPAPVPLPLDSDCIAGAVSKDTSEKGDGSKRRSWARHVCCGDRCRCDDPPCAVVSPVEMAGRETWRARLDELKP